MSIDLGMPAPPAPTLAPRRVSRQLNVGGVLVGGGARFELSWALALAVAI